MTAKADAPRAKLRRIEPLLAQAEALSRATPPWAQRMAARRVAEQRRACPVRDAIQASLERRG